MTTIELTGIVVGALAAFTVGGGAWAARAINAPDKGKHAARRDRDDDTDGTATRAWLRSARTGRIPPLVLARVHVAALRAVLAGAAPAPVLVHATPPRVHVTEPVPAPPAERPEWTGDLDDTGWLPANTDWCKYAPLDEVTRAV